MPSYAEEYRTFMYNLKRYGFSLSKDELKQMAITIALISFIWGFGKFGDSPSDFLIVGIKNFVLGAVFATLGMIINQVGQRIVAVHYGYDPIYEYGILGLMIGLVITFASRGFLVFFFPGVITLRHLAASRLGEFRYYTNDWEWAKAAFLGPVLNIAAAAIVSPWKSNEIIFGFMIMNILYAFYSLVPLPGNLGLHIFYPHIYVWTFCLGIVTACTAMLFFLHPILTLVLGLILGVGAMWYHFAVMDKWFG